MIYPIPPGVDPATHYCGCGSDFRMPWQSDFQGGHYILICRADEWHQTYKPKHTGTRNLRRIDASLQEVNIMTGREVTGLETSLAIIDEATALARVQKAEALGLWPDKATPLQQQHLAIVAFHYGLDPLMGEIMPYQGKPYITIKGRRRKDGEAKHAADISFRPLTADETEWFKMVDALRDGDLAMYCVMRDVTTTARVEGFGRVLATERDPKRLGANNLPQVQRVIEMVEKRGEMRAREMLWGSIAKPPSMPDDIQVGLEGVDIIESTGRLVDESQPQVEATTGQQRPAPETASQSLPDYGECWIHPGQMFVTTKLKFGLNASHQDGDRKNAEGKQMWCRLQNRLKERFGKAWEAKNGSTEEPAVRAWLKEHYGDTWSKLSYEDMFGAVAALTPPPGVDPGTGVINQDDGSSETDEQREAYQAFLTESEQDRSEIEAIGL